MSTHPIWIRASDPTIELERRRENSCSRAPGGVRRQGQRGDFLLVACDGLAAHVENQTIEQLLSRPTAPAQHLATQLVNMADEGGGTDNCTVVVAHFS